MHYRMILPILIHASPILILWLGFRLSTPYLNTLDRHDSSQQHPRQRISIEHPSRQPKTPSAANQNRVLRNWSRQPIRIEYCVTRVVTRELSAPEGPFSALGSRLESARYSLSYYMGTFTSHLISSHFYYCYGFFGRRGAGVRKNDQMNLSKQHGTVVRTQLLRTKDMNFSLNYFKFCGCSLFFLIRLILFTNSCQ